MPLLRESVRCTASVYSHWAVCSSAVCTSRRYRMQHTGVGPCDRCHREAALLFRCLDLSAERHYHGSAWNTDPKLCRESYWSVVCESCAQGSFAFT